MPLQETPLGFQDSLAEEEPHLRDYWRILRKHLRLISGSTFGIVIITAIVVSLMTPQYTAETTLLIERKAPQAIKVEGAQPETVGPDEYDYYKTQYEILRSHALASQVISEQQLEQHPWFAAHKDTFGFLTNFLERVSSWMSGNRVESPDDQSTVDSHAIKNYLRQLEVKPFPRTRLVKITFTSSDPELSSRVVNAHAEAFMHYGVEMRTRANMEAQKFLEEKLVELKERVEKSEAALNDYRRDKGILSLDEKENIVVDRLSDLNRRLTDAEASRIELEAQVRLIRKRDYNSLPAVLENALIQTLKGQLSAKESDYSQLSARFKSDYPKVVQLKADIDEARHQINVEIARVVAGIESGFLAAEGKERSLREKMEEQKAATLGMKDASVNYAILAREVDTNRQLYDSVLQRMKEMGVAAELRSSNVAVVDKGETPQYPSKPKKGMMLAVSFALGLLGGIGVAFFLEYLDNTIKTPEEVQRHLGLPSLGVVPEFASIIHATGVAPKSLESSGQEKPDSAESKAISRALATSSRMELVLSHHPLSLIAEAYRTLRTALFLSRAGEAPRTILFTSAIEGEGKTLTTINTAVIFAQMGLRVVVIDADLRRPRCHKVLGIRNWVGLTEVLTGHKEAQDVIKSTVTDNLFLMPSGAIPPNPAELIGSRKMKELITNLLQQYDCIIIDTPPVMPVSDGLLIARLVDGVVLVVNGQKTPRHLVKEARSRLLYARAKILGVVLNRIDMVKGEYAYYYGHYSSYYRHSTTEQDEEQHDEDDDDSQEKMSA